MSSNNFDEYDLYDEFEELNGYVPKHIRNVSRKPKRPRLKDKFNIITEKGTAAALSAQTDDRRTMSISYKASRTEGVWLNESLGSFFEQRWFDDVLQIIKGGKEASVYQLKGSAVTGQAFLAAKVYRPRMFRALKNDQLYRQGRANLDADGLEIINDGMLKAIDQRSAYGLRLIHTSWIEHEVRTMKQLKAAGCDVPQCYASGDNAVLMDYIGGPDVPAATLIDVSLSRTEAERLFDRVLRNIETMLANDIIHGDLSAYNILYWEGAVTLIDFPQAVNPHKNRSAYEIFERDVTRVCEYFARQGVRVKGRPLARRIWEDHGLRLGPDVHPADLDPDDEDDYRYWEAYRT